MRYREIVEARGASGVSLEEALSGDFAALRSPAFREWFRGSKVVDPQGAPLVCYHGSFVDVQGPWRVFTHFGTAEAASHRANPDGYDLDQIDGPPRIYPVFLRITNPIWYEDDPSEDPEVGPWDALDNLMATVTIDPAEVQAIKAMWRTPSEQTERLAQLFERHGHDGLAYRNRVEDAGSVSWVVFRDDQVWSAFSTGR